NHARAKYVAAANRGWMSVKTLPPADQVKCFYLTSPFIEPAHYNVIGKRLNELLYCHTRKKT
ncbi:MAG: hypothetical protein ABSE55_14705, partial [Terracidiphilus sp.]